MTRQPTPTLLADPPVSIQDDVALIFAPAAPVDLSFDAGVVPVPLDLIDDNPWQPRQTYDPAALEELAASIERNGLQQIPAARRIPDGRVQLKFGHRRKRALDLLRAKDGARWATMPLQIIAASDEEMCDHAWAENNDRADLSAIEQARALQSALDQFGWSQAELARRRGMSPATLSNKLSLLRLPADTQAAISERNISGRQAAAIVSLFDIPADIRQRAEQQYDSSLRPSSIIRDALAGASSDELRKRAGDMVRRHAHAIENEPWYKTEFGENVSPFEASRCQQCAHALKRDNGVFCTGPDQCRTNKAQRFALEDLYEAAAEIGLPAAGKLTYGDYTTMDNYDTRTTLRRLLGGEGCPHGLLQLMWVKPQDRRGLRPYPQFPQAEVVCNHGAGKKCRCVLADQRAKSAQGDGKTTASAQKLILNRAVPILARALLEVDEGLLRHVITRAISYDLAPNSSTLAWSRQELAEQVAEKIVRNQVQEWNSVNQSRQLVTTMFVNAGLRDPFGLASGIAAGDDTTIPVL